MNKIMTIFGAFVLVVLGAASTANAQSVMICGKSVAADTTVLVCDSPNLTGIEKLARLEKLKVRGGLDDAGLAPLAEHPTLKVLDIEGASVGNEGIQHLGKITSLEGLNLGKTNVTDAGLEPLRALTLLRRLSLRGTEVDGDGLVYLSNMPLLKWLDLTDTDIDDEAISQLSKLRSVRELLLDGTNLTPSGLLRTRKSLPRTEISAKGLGEAFEVCGQTVTTDMTELTCDAGFTDGAQLARLSEITALEELTIRGDAMDDRSMRHIQGDELRKLDLTGTAVGDDGLAGLRKVPALTVLHLTKTQVTDEGILELTNFDALREVYVAGTRVTKDGVAAFRKAKPGCRLVR